MPCTARAWRTVSRRRPQLVHVPVVDKGNHSGPATPKGTTWARRNACDVAGSTRPTRGSCRAAHAVADQADTIACEDLTVPMKSAGHRHKNTNQRLNGWVKGIVADTFTAISRRRGSVLVLVNPAHTSQIDFQAGLLQAIVAGTGFTARTGLCRTRTTMPPATSARGSTTTGSCCGRAVGRSRPCSRRKPGCRWGLLHPASGCRGVPTCSHQPRANYQEPLRNSPDALYGFGACGRARMALALSRGSQLTGLRTCTEACRVLVAGSRSGGLSGPVGLVLGAGAMLYCAVALGP